METSLRCGLIMALLMATTADAYASGDISSGQLLYQSRCISCHSMEYNGVGPAHKGLFGRKAGSVKGYTYSAALQASTIIWSEATLERWLKNPEKLLPGQKMGISVTSARERADLIAYLKKETEMKP